MVCPTQYLAQLAIKDGELLRMPIQVIIETNSLDVPYPWGSSRYIMAKQEKTA
jgi:hypothetical protein